MNFFNVLFRIYGVLFLIFLVPHFWIPFVGWGVAKEVARYKTSWGTFQVRYYRVTGENLTFPKLKILIVIISIGCLLCAILFILSMSVLLEGFTLWHTCAYCKFKQIQFHVKVWKIIPLQITQWQCLTWIQRFGTLTVEG